MNQLSTFNWPSIAIAVMLSTIIACVLAILNRSSGSTDFVVIDVARIQAAQTKIASDMLGREDAAGETITKLAQISTNVQKVILDTAGPGRVVLVKQAVVATNLPDITDAVLTTLGLPLDVVVNYKLQMPSGDVSTAAVATQRSAVKDFAERPAGATAADSKLKSVLP